MTRKRDIVRGLRGGEPPQQSNHPVAAYKLPESVSASASSAGTHRSSHSGGSESPDSSGNDTELSGTGSAAGPTSHSGATSSAGGGSSNSSHSDATSTEEEDIDDTQTLTDAHTRTDADSSHQPSLMDTTQSFTNILWSYVPFVGSAHREDDSTRSVEAPREVRQPYFRGIGRLKPTRLLAGSHHASQMTSSTGDDASESARDVAFATEESDFSRRLAQQWRNQALETATLMDAASLKGAHGGVAALNLNDDNGVDNGVVSVPNGTAHVAEAAPVTEATPAKEAEPVSKAALESTPVAEAPPETTPVTETSTTSTSPLPPLTHEQRHYLNRVLISMQLQREFGHLSQEGALSRYGRPFETVSMGPVARAERGEESTFLSSILPWASGHHGTMEQRHAQEAAMRKVPESPLLSLFFHECLETFPIIARAPTPFFSETLQQFFDSLAERSLSTTLERSQITKRRMVSMCYSLWIGLFTAGALKTTGPQSHVQPSPVLKSRIENLFPGSFSDQWRTEDASADVKLWVALLPHGRDGYIVLTRMGGAGTALPQAKSHHTEKAVLFVQRKWSDIIALYSNLGDIVAGLNLPPLPAADPGIRVTQRIIRSIVIALSRPVESRVAPAALTAARAALEKFLVSDPLKVTGDQGRALYTQARQADQRRHKDRKVWTSLGKQSSHLRSRWDAFIVSLVNEPDFLASVVRLVGAQPDPLALPEEYRDVLEMVNIWLAGVIHYIFVDASTAPEVFRLAKQIHSLIPYALLRAALNIINPAIALRTVLSIALGQVGNRPSLLQRLLAVIIRGELKTYRKVIAQHSLTLHDQPIVEALKAYVYSPRPQRQRLEALSQSAEEELVITILRDSPHVPTPSVDKALRWHAAFIKEWRETLQTPTSPDGQAFFALKALLRILCLKRDREQIIKMVMEPATPAMVKSLFNICYDWLYNVTQATSLADRLADLQVFIDDMIAVCSSDSNSVADMLNLCRRHYKSAYKIFHDVIKNAPDLALDVASWFSKCLEFFRNGISEDGHHLPGSQPSPEPRLSVDLDALLASHSNVVQNKVRQELSSMELWITYHKARQNVLMRATLLEAQLGISLDRAALLQDLFSQDPLLSQYLIDRHSQFPPQGAIDWAWYAPTDIHNTLSTIKLAWDENERGSVDDGGIFLFASDLSGSRRRPDDTGPGAVVTSELYMPSFVGTSELLPAFSTAVSRLLKKYTSK